MNEKRFLELLNLHLDGEISPAEREALDREIAACPRRRETYRSYARLQEASQLVYREFGQALTETVDLKKYEILARSSTRCCLRRGLLYSTGALAAASLTVVAAVSVFRDAQEHPIRGFPPQERYAEVEIIDPESLNPRQQPDDAFPRSAVPSYLFAGRSNFFERAGQRSAFFHPSSVDFPPSPSPSQWRNLLESPPTTRIYSSNAPLEVTSELSSFQFQR